MTMENQSVRSMTETLTAPGGWESERETERAKVAVRWVAIVLLLAALLWIRRHDPTVAARVSAGLAWSLAGAATLMTLMEAVFLWRTSRDPAGAFPRWLKYVTVLGDMTFVTVLIFYTGFTRSPFFFVYFVFLISNCLRYGLWMSLFVALVFNVEYAICLSLASAEEVSPSVLGGEGLKIVAFWAVALYGGAISARLRRQANQLRAYEETILDLRAKLRETSREVERESEA